MQFRFPTNRSWSVSSSIWHPFDSSTTVQLSHYPHLQYNLKIANQSQNSHRMPDECHIRTLHHIQRVKNTNNKNMFFFLCCATATGACTLCKQINCKFYFHWLPKICVYAKYRLKRTSAIVHDNEFVQLTCLRVAKKNAFLIDWLDVVLDEERDRKKRVYTCNECVGDFDLLPPYSQNGTVPSFCAK